MDAWRRTLAQFRDLVNGMAPGQRLTLIAVPLLVFAFLGLAISRGNPIPEEIPLDGKAFTARESKHAQELLRKAGLNGFRVDGERILVPAADAARYYAALNSSSADGGRSGSEMKKALGIDSYIPPTSEQRQEMITYANCERVAAIIRKIHGIADAEIVSQRSRPRSYVGDSKMTATLSVTPHAGVDLSDDLRRDLRQTVSGALNMAERDVTVLDTRTGATSGRPNAVGPVSVPFAGAHGSQSSLAHSAELVAAETPVRSGTSDTSPRRSRKSPAVDSLTRWAWPAGVVVTTLGTVLILGRGIKRRKRAAAPLPDKPEPSASPSPRAREQTVESKQLPAAKAVESESARIETGEPDRVALPAARAEPAIAPHRRAPPVDDGRLPLSSVPFGFLHDTGADHVLSFVTGEHPQTIALILSHLPAPLAARVLGGLPSTKQLEVVERVAAMQQTSPEVVRDVARSLKERMTAALRRPPEAVGGPSAAAQRRGGADHRTHKALLRHLETEDSELGERIRSLLFDFDDLLKVDDHAIAPLFDRSAAAPWAMALKGASRELQSKVLENLPPRSAETLLAELHDLGPVRVGDIATAQREIAEQVAHSDITGDRAFGIYRKHANH